MVSKAKLDAETERLAELAAVRSLKKVFPDERFGTCTYCGHWAMITDRKVRMHPLCRYEHEADVQAGRTSPSLVQGELSL